MARQWCANHTDLPIFFPTKSWAPAFCQDRGPKKTAGSAGVTVTSGDPMPDQRTCDLDPAQSPPDRPEKLGTPLAINHPPLTLTELTKQTGKRRGLIANPVPSFEARRVERLFAVFLAATPPGARRQWRTQRALDTISFRLDEGISEADLREHFAGAAELIRRGYQAARWWSLANVLGSKTLERWRADIHDMRCADDRLRELQRRDEEHREINRNAPAPKVRDLGLRRLVNAAEAAYQTHQWSDAAQDEVDDG